MNESIKIKIIFVLISCWLVLLLGYFIAVRPPLNRWAVLTQKYHLLKIKLSSTPQLTIPLINHHVDTAFLIASATKMGEKSHLTELTITPYKKINVPPIIIDQWQLTAQGSFSEINDFYNQLFQSHFLFTLPHWEWTQSTKNAITVKANIEVYHY